MSDWADEVSIRIMAQFKPLRLQVPSVGAILGILGEMNSSQIEAKIATALRAERAKCKALRKAGNELISSLMDAWGGITDEETAEFIAAWRAAEKELDAV